jgi:hypothetical protein
MLLLRRLGCCKDSIDAVSVVLFQGMLISNVSKALIIVDTTSLQWSDSQGFFVWEN